MKPSFALFVNFSVFVFTSSALKINKFRLRPKLLFFILFLVQSILQADTTPVVLPSTALPVVKNQIITGGKVLPKIKKKAKNLIKIQNIANMINRGKKMGRRRRKGPKVKRISII